MMLAPIRDYLGPQDPASFTHLCAVKDRYFTRLSVGVYPDPPAFGESSDVWGACIHFMEHLY